MLVLFDIDATLIRTSRAGVFAMHDAGRELFSPDFHLDGVEFGGSLDPLIMRDLLMRNGHEPTRENLARYREGYAARLFRKLTEPGIGEILPGVPAILDRLEAEGSVTIGLLTGNFPETGAAKLRACGLDPGRFKLSFFATDSPHDPPARHHLTEVAIERYGAHVGRPAHGRDIVVIGDTPQDVHCALANDCWVIAVATGSFSREELDRRGAHLAVPTLEDTGGLVKWILGRRSIV